MIKRTFSAAILLSALLITGCKDEADVECEIIGEWEYVNDSGHYIVVTGFSPFVEEARLEIAPDESRTVYTYAMGRCKNVPPERCPPVFYDNIPRVVYDGEVEEVFELTELIGSRYNYEVEAVGPTHYRFSYTFTDADYRRALEKKELE